MKEYTVMAWDKRGRMLVALTWKSHSKTDRVRVPATWTSRQAAAKWAAENPDRVPYGYQVTEKRRGYQPAPKKEQPQ